MAGENGYAQVQTETDEDDNAETAKPYLDAFQVAVNGTHRVHRVGDEQGDNQYRKSITEAEEDRHKPTPGDRLEQGQRNECAEVEQAAVRAKSESKQHAQKESPEATSHEGMIRA